MNRVRRILWCIPVAAAVAVHAPATAQTTPCMSFDTSQSAAAGSKVIPQMVLHSDGGCAAVRPGAVLRTVTLVAGRSEGTAEGLRGFRGPDGLPGPRGVTPPRAVCRME